ncbi:MAG: GlgB N-terminal domain-containing protein, partial [Acidimicrobiales bacterium]
MKVPPPAKGPAKRPAQDSGPPPVAGSGPDDLARLVAGEHGDPHRVLGPHGGVVWALRPGAESVHVVLPDGREVEMGRRHQAGLWAADVSDL